MTFQPRLRRQIKLASHGSGLYGETSNFNHSSLLWLFWCFILRQAESPDSVKGKLIDRANLAWKPKKTFFYFVCTFACTLYIPELNKYVLAHLHTQTDFPNCIECFFLTGCSLFIFNDLVHLFALSVCFVVRKYFNTLWTLI